MHNLNIVEDINSLVYKEIYPGIIVYQNMLSDPNKAYDIMMNSEANSNGKYFFKDWTPWAQFGTYTAAKEEHFWKDSIQDDTFHMEKNLYDEIAIAYDRAISHYFMHTKIEIPEGARYSGQSWCKYNEGLDNFKNNLTMQYHTDFIISQKDMPGDKFHTTCTFYINDNYDGGDLNFYVNGHFIDYKPKAGDLVIFPSNEPYFHGVKTIKNGNKFFIRNFVIFTYEGSAEWFENQKIWGAYKWSLKEIERIEKEDKVNMMYFKDRKQISYKEALEGQN